MIRVLQVIDHMGLGGIQAFIMNVYRKIDRNKIQFDFLVHKKEGNTFAEEIHSLGGIIHYVPARNQGLLNNKRALDIFFKNNSQYKVVHQHESSLSYIEPLIAAKNNNVPIRIIHSHSTRMGNSIFHKALHFINAKRIHTIATNYLACGELAGVWFYGKSKVKNNFTIIINGIQLDKYQYNEALRLQIRKEMRLEDSVTLCHIGRFDSVKNHAFLIEIFNEFLKNKHNAKLVLIGDGVLKNDVENKVKKMGMTSNVLFLGLRNDINILLQGVDAVILPSLYEGFPITAIEAQAAGVSFFMSDNISKEVLIKSNSYSLSLNHTAIEWAEYIASHLSREPNNMIMYERNFDIQNTVDNLFKIYINGGCEKNN